MFPHDLLSYLLDTHLHMFKLQLALWRRYSGTAVGNTPVKQKVLGLITVGYNCHCGNIC